SGIVLDGAGALGGDRRTLIPAPSKTMGGRQTMSQRLKDKIVVVTGAAGGMGQAFARAFASEGAALILTDVAESPLNELAAALRSEGVTCFAQPADLADANAIGSFATRVCSEHAQIDVLINNAGLAYGEIAHGFAELSQEKWLRYFSINTVAPLLLGQ